MAVARHALLVLMAVTAPSALADNNQVVVTAIAASDWLYHGTTESDGAPVLGLNAEWHASRGFFVGVQGHEARKRGYRQRERAAMAYAGYTLPERGGWAATMSLARREFLASVKDWDFTEWSVDLAHRDGFGLRADFSSDYYAHNTRSLALEARYLRDLGNRWYGKVSAGRVELSNPVWLDHHYFQLTLGRAVGAANIELVGHWNNQGSDRDFGREDYSDPSIAVQIGLRLW